MEKTKLKDLMIQKTTAGTGSMILRHTSLLPLSTKTYSTKTNKFSIVMADVQIDIFLRTMVSALNTTNTTVLLLEFGLISIMQRAAQHCRKKKKSKKTLMILTMMKRRARIVKKKIKSQRLLD